MLPVPSGPIEKNLFRGAEMFDTALLGRFNENAKVFRLKRSVDFIDLTFNYQHAIRTGSDCGETVKLVRLRCALNRAKRGRTDRSRDTRKNVSASLIRSSLTGRYDVRVSK
jgi:hypothetical protein